MERGGVLLQLLQLVFLVFWPHVSVAQAMIPSKFDGFAYKGALPNKDSIVVEAFFDPLCPDSRESWPPLKMAIEHYSPHISLAVHVFPLPYHENAFVASRALTVADGINPSTTYPLLEQFFEYQEIYYNEPTSNMSRTSIIKSIMEFTAKAVGNNHSLSKVESGFADFATNRATRTSFKYGCSRGVTGTPYFFINGFPLPDGGRPLDYDKWRSIIDPLIAED